MPFVKVDDTTKNNYKGKWVSMNKYGYYTIDIIFGNNENIITKIILKNEITEVSKEYVLDNPETNNVFGYRFLDKSVKTNSLESPIIIALKDSGIVTKSIVLYREKLHYHNKNLFSGLMISRNKTETYLREFLEGDKLNYNIGETGLVIFDKFSEINLKD